jgi:hypothetical protein
MPTGSSSGDLFPCIHGAARMLPASPRHGKFGAANGLNFALSSQNIFL